MPRREIGELVQEFDQSKSLVGQDLLHVSAWGSSHHGKPFRVKWIDLEHSYYRNVTKVSCKGSIIKKDGSVGQVAGSCSIPLSDVPLVDLENLLRKHRQRLIGGARVEFDAMLYIYAVLNDRSAEVSPQERAIDEKITDLMETFDSSWKRSTH